MFSLLKDAPRALLRFLLVRSYFDLLSGEIQFLFALRADTIMSLYDLCGGFQFEAVIQN